MSAALPAALTSLSCVLATMAANRVQRDLIFERAGVVPRTAAARRESPRRARAVDLAVRRLAVRGVALAAGIGIGGVLATAPGAVAGAAVALAAPRIRRRRLEARRAELVGAQLADAVAGISARLRAGLSLTQAIRSAADDVEEPLASSFRDLADRTSLGVPFDESVEAWAASLPSAETRLVAGVLGLHRRTGGNAPAVLDQVARTLGERRAAAREVRSLTAQARLSGAILGLLPIGFFLFLSATSRGDMAAAYRSPEGTAAILVGLVMQSAAFFWIRRLLQVEP
ncbi:MAG: type II secretion system F family protein [Actinomycetota bacterium]